MDRISVITSRCPIISHTIEWTAMARMKTIGRDMGMTVRDIRRTLVSVKETASSIDSGLARVFIPWALRNPRYIGGFRRLSKAHRITERKRIAVLNKDNDTRIPPFLILSLTSRCNLSCQGCFASAVGNRIGPSETDGTCRSSHLTLDQWKDILREASDLGVIGFVLAGGEPFLYPEMLDLCREFNDRLFIVVTNGTAFTDSHYSELKKLGNVVILVSIEGGTELTDGRRGSGVHAETMQALRTLRQKGVLFGISVTITRNNYRYWMQHMHIDALIDQGVRIGAFMEYIPLSPPPVASGCTGYHDTDRANEIDTYGMDHHLMLTGEERSEFRRKMLYYRENKNLYIIHSPGDEEKFGGCVSAGRGFAHITPIGDLTPCPVSNIATHNLSRSSLQDALSGRLFREIRENEHLLETEGMPCALFAHPREVDALARNVGAYRTNTTATS